MIWERLIHKKWENVLQTCFSSPLVPSFGSTKGWSHQTGEPASSWSKEPNHGTTFTWLQFFTFLYLCCSTYGRTPLNQQPVSKSPWITTTSLLFINPKYALPKLHIWNGGAEVLGFWQEVLWWNRRFKNNAGSKWQWHSRRVADLYSPWGINLQCRAFWLLAKNNTRRSRSVGRIWKLSKLVLEWRAGGKLLLLSSSVACSMKRIIGFILE